MKPFAAFAVAVLLVFGCARQEPAPPAASETALQEKLSDDSAESTSILEIARGATIVARTGEILLDFSALRMIDGEPNSFWTNPQHDLPQSVTIALPARSRIDRLGIRTVSRGAFTANHVLFESSLDGRTFTPVTTIKSADSSEPQWFDVKPFEASQIRATIQDGLLPGHDVRVHSLLARGTELEAPHPGDISGCWSINGERAQFERKGTRVAGVLEAGKEPIHFEGGANDRVIRLSWIRGNDYGISLLTVSPDGQHLNGLNWHEEAIPMFFDTVWFGERQPCAAPLPQFDVATALLRRTGRFSLYDASQLPRLLKANPNAVLVAHEFRLANAQQNREAAQRAAGALRDEFHLQPGIKFVVLGSDDPRQQPVTDVMRTLYSTVDLEIRR